MTQVLERSTVHGYLPELQLCKTFRGNGNAAQPPPAPREGHQCNAPGKVWCAEQRDKHMSRVDFMKRSEPFSSATVADVEDAVLD